jgi:hypothetical protein
MLVVGKSFALTEHIYGNIEWRSIGSQENQPDANTDPSNPSLASIQLPPEIIDYVDSARKSTSPRHSGIALRISRASTSRKLAKASRFPRRS